jgi:hypothetical protein
VLPLAVKTTLIGLRVTGIFGTINKGVDREVEGVEIEVKVAEVEAIGVKMSHVRTKSKRIILRTSYYPISVLFAARRATIKLIVLFIRGFKPSI